jgi:hypothetical protein
MAIQFGPTRCKRPILRLTTAGALAVALLVSACGSGTEKADPGASTTPSTSGTTAPVVKKLGNGVTANEIKIGIGLIDYDTIKDVPDLAEVRLEQQEIYEGFIKEINDKGGVAGRKLVPVFKKYIPIVIM